MKNQRRNVPITRDKVIRRKRIFLFFRILFVGFLFGLLVGYFIGKNKFTVNLHNNNDEITQSNHSESQEISTSQSKSAETEESSKAVSRKEYINWNEEWKYASYSKIHDDCIILYHSNADEKKNIVIAINAGHGTPGGDSVRTMCHPDGSPKVTGGSTAVGEKYVAAISSGMTFLDGTEEAKATLSLAIILKDKLLVAGYDVLMIRETNNCHIDNIARTVFANENADCHIALHYDSSENDKGFFYISVPNIDSYRSMEPVASYWHEHMKLGDAILSGVKDKEFKIFSNGSMAIDLTQTSYSTIPSVDIEVGDKASDISEETQTKMADGILRGIELYFK